MSVQRKRVIMPVNRRVIIAINCYRRVGFEVNTYEGAWWSITGTVKL